MSVGDLFLWLWTALILASIGWYGFLLFYVGVKAGRDIRQLTRRLRERNRVGKPGS